MHKIIALAFVVGLILSEYFIITNRQKYLCSGPAAIGSAWRLWRRPIKWILNTRIFKQAVSWFTGHVSEDAEKYETNLTAIEESQEIPQINFPEQPEEEEPSYTTDLDDYLNDPESFMAILLLFICGLLIELLIIGYFFIYPIYLDRYSGEKDKNNKRRENPRRTKKNHKKKRTNKTTF